MIKQLLHWTSALQLRLSLLSEVKRSQANGSKLFPNWRNKIWKAPHNHEEFVWLLSFINPSEKLRLLDIGGNSGYWAEDFLSYFPQTSILAFEPVPAMFEAYQKRFEGRNQVRVFNTALGDANEKKTIHVAEGYGLTSFNTYSEAMQERNQHFTSNVEVVISRLDQFEEQVQAMAGDKTIIKVDVQGFETKVVRGGKAVFANADMVILECSFTNEFQQQLPTFGEIVTLLRELDLHPIEFGVFDRLTCHFGYERNVLFIKSNYFQKTWK